MSGVAARRCSLASGGRHRSPREGGAAAAGTPPGNRSAPDFPKSSSFPGATFMYAPHPLRKRGADRFERSWGARGVFVRHTWTAEEGTRMGSSRLPGFYKMRMAERLRRLAEQLELSRDELEGLGVSATLPLSNADAMIENAVGVLGLPVGIGLNFLINGEDVLIPMAVEEPSVIAAVSLAAKIAREGGGFEADADEPRMIGQVQLSGLTDPEAAQAAILREKDAILAAANALHPAMKARGGGAKDPVVRLLPVGAETHAIVHLIIDTQDAMGANLINTMCEGVAPLIERITGGRVRLRILSNLADLRLARASCRIPLDRKSTRLNSSHPVIS